MLMKKVLITMTGIATLCLYSAVLEDARQIVRRYTEDFIRCTDGLYFTEIEAKLREIDRDVQMSVYLEMIAEKADDPQAVDRIIYRFGAADGWNRASYGNQEALDWTRKALRDEEQRFPKIFASFFLMTKGDARDLDIVSSAHSYRDKLVARVAGTNLVDYYPSHQYTDWFECFPSVTNTGPQGLYVHTILRQFWENLEIEDHLIEGKSYSFRDKSKIPAELLTMVVWFDDEGKPVCNVDLSKYGLTMPELDVPNKPKPKEKVEVTEAPPNREKSSDGIPAVETSDRFQPPGQTHTTPPWRLPLLIGILILGGTVVAWRSIRRNKS